jgi:hypothetical protein
MLYCTDILITFVIIAPARGLTMTSFVGCKTDRPKPGFQRHHLIPLEIVRKPHFRDLFNTVRSKGFNPNDFRTNGMWLPATEELTVEYGLAMHRGPHPQYSELVSDWIAQLARAQLRHPVELNHLLLLLQRRLRKFLTNRPSYFLLNRNDPLRARAGFSSVDDDIDKLWPDLPQS